MFGKKQVKVAKKVEEPKDIAVKLDVNLEEKKEEYELAEEMGLIRQMEMIKLEKLGYKIIRRNDCERLLDVDKDVRLSSYSLDEFLGKIPFSIINKAKAVIENKEFDRVWIVAPTERSSVDPLLIGEKFTSADYRYPETTVTYGATYSAGVGYRNGNFWRRDSIVALIGKWE